MKHHPSRRGGRIVEDSENAIPASHAQLPHSGEDTLHGPSVRHAERLSHLQPEEASSDAGSRVLWKSADLIARPRMKNDRPHVFNVSNLRQKRLARGWENLDEPTRVTRDIGELRRLQAERRTAREAAVKEAAILAQAAEAKGERVDTAGPFLRRNFEFSAFEIACIVNHHSRFEQARMFVAASQKAQGRAT